MVMKTGLLASECFVAEPEPKGTLDYPAILVGFNEGVDHVTIDTLQAREIIKLIQLAIEKAEQQ